MQRTLIFMTLAIALVLTSASSFAAVDRNEFGLGFVIGEPTGLNAQFFWNKNTAVDFTAAWSMGDWMMLAGDYQIYNYIGDAPREWRWYYGLGAFLKFPEDEDLKLGFRVPLGVKYHFPYSIIDIWAEIAPGIELIDDTNAILHGGLGLTLWLK